MTTKKSNKSKKRWAWWEILVASLLIVFVILTLGIFIRDERKDKLLEDAEKPSPLIGDPVPYKIQETKKRLHLLEKRILELENWNNRINFVSRIIIGCIVILANVIFMWFCNSDINIGIQLQFNETMLILYAFVAFITYGTPNRMINSLRPKIMKMFVKKHLSIQEELEALKKERANIKKTNLKFE